MKMNRKSFFGLVAGFLAIPFIAKRKTEPNIVGGDILDVNGKVIAINKLIQNPPLIGSKVIVDPPEGISNIVPKAANGKVIGILRNYHIGNNRAAIQFLSADDHRIHVAGYNLSDVTKVCPNCDGTGRVSHWYDYESSNQEEGCKGTVGLSCGIVGQQGPAGRKLI